MNETILIALLADLEAALRKAREALTATAAPAAPATTTTTTAPATTTTASALVEATAPVEVTAPAPVEAPVTEPEPAPAPKPKRGRPAQVTDLTPAPSDGMDRTAFMAAARDILQRHGNDQTPVRKTLDDFSIATPMDLEPSQYKPFLAALKKNYGES